MGIRIVHRGTQADIAVVQQVFLARDYDLTRLRRHDEIQRFYQRCARPLIVDAGANIGASSVWFARTYPKAIVKAVEPHPGNFAVLTKNVSGLNVTSKCAAVAPRPGVLRLLDPGGGDWAFRTGDSEGVDLGEVPALTIESLIEPGEEPFICKIDIEGGEADLFESAVFSRFPVVVIELHDWMIPKGRTSQSFLRWHVQQDRDFVYINENIFSICNRLL